MFALTFRIDGFVGAKNVDLEAIMVGRAFVIPEFAVALLLDIATQQEIAVDLVANLARKDTLRSARGLDKRRVALNRRRSVHGLSLFGGAATLGLLTANHCSWWSGGVREEVFLVVVAGESKNATAKEER